MRKYYKSAREQQSRPANLIEKQTINKYSFKIPKATTPNRILYLIPILYPFLSNTELVYLNSNL